MTIDDGPGIAAALMGWGFGLLALDQSNDCASTVFGLALAATKRRYSSSSRSPNLGAPPSTRDRHSSKPIAGPPPQWAPSARPSG